MKIIPVTTFDEVLDHALVQKLVAIEWPNVDSVTVSEQPEKDVGGVVTH